MANIGEAGEMALKMRLIRMRDEGIRFEGELVIDVGFDEPYDTIDEGIYEQAQQLYEEENWDAVYDLGLRCGFRKAGSADKADVYINHRGYSVKNMDGAPPALINHTKRSGFERVCAVVGCDKHRQPHPPLHVIVVDIQKFQSVF